MQKIAIVDYGMGNYHSVARALQHAAPEADVKLCQSAREIDAADRVVFPGQGAICLLYTSPSPRDRTRSRMPSSA